MSNINKSYIIGVDICDKTNQSVLTVIERILPLEDSKGKRFKVINTFVGEEAEELYHRLIDPKTN